MSDKEPPDIEPDEVDADEGEQGEPLVADPGEDESLYFDERVQKWAA